MAKYMEKEKSSVLSEAVARKVLQNMLIYENENIAVLNKPAGMTVQGGSDV